jgi:hypothetical protein
MKGFERQAMDGRLRSNTSPRRVAIVERRLLAGQKQGLVAASGQAIMQLGPGGDEGFGLVDNRHG